MGGSSGILPGNVIMASRAWGGSSGILPGNAGIAGTLTGLYHVQYTKGDFHLCLLAFARAMSSSSCVASCIRRSQFMPARQTAAK